MQLRHLFPIVAMIPAMAGCNLETGSPADAVVIGRIVAAGGTTKGLTAADGTCPDVLVTVNAIPVSVDYDSDCSFVISDVPAVPLLSIRIELVALGVAGTVEIEDVASGELIEIAVTPADNSLSIAVERRATPVPDDTLQTVISANNASIQLPAGIYQQTLTVNGNNFTLVGEAGASCGDTADWTVIEGDVTVNGNNATFRNIQFGGALTLEGNNAHFINCCFNGGLVVFGNNADFGDDDHDDDSRGGRGSRR